jgi:hypothetical protein
LPKSTVNLEIQEAYDKLKANLIQKGCTVLYEQSPSQISLRQGSLWGISPKNAKKTITLTLQPQGNKTTIEYSSKLAKDWKNITLIGCLLAAILASVCVWMALDLSAFMMNGNPSFWSWVVTANQQVLFQAGEAFINLAWGLAIFLSVIIALEIAVFINCQTKIETLSEEAINQLG